MLSERSRAERRQHAGEIHVCIGSPNIIRTLAMFVVGVVVRERKTCEERSSSAFVPNSDCRRITCRLDLFSGNSDGRRLPSNSLRLRDKTTNIPVQ